MQATLNSKAFGEDSFHAVFGTMRGRKSSYLAPGQKPSETPFINSFGDVHELIGQPGFHLIVGDYKTNYTEEFISRDAADFGKETLICHRKYNSPPEFFDVFNYSRKRLKAFSKYLVSIAGLLDLSEDIGQADVIILHGFSGLCNGAGAEAVAREAKAVLRYLHHLAHAEGKTIFVSLGDNWEKSVGEYAQTLADIIIEQTTIAKNSFHSTDFQTTIIKDRNGPTTDGPVAYGRATYDSSALEGSKYGLTHLLEKPE